MNEPREFLIDMSVPAEERWQDVIASCRRNALKLARWVLTALDRVPLSHVIRGAIAASHKRSDNLFEDDLSAWAAGLGMPHRDLMAVNSAHEMAQFTDTKLTCTSVVMHTKQFGMIHGRNFDWDMKGAGDSTVVYHFVGGPLEYMAVSFPGLVGVISGMGPGRFSITLNRATPQGRPTLDWGPQILARHVLEVAYDFDEALQMLCETPLRTPGIFTLASADGDQACVIERTRKDYAMRDYNGSPLVASNHYLTPELKEYNTTPALIDISQSQMRTAARMAEQTDIVELGDLFAVLSGEGILTETTCQQIALASSEGLYCAVGRNS